jgi:hypothetical protein
MIEHRTLKGSVASAIVVSKNMFIRMEYIAENVRELLANIAGVSNVAESEGVFTLQLAEDTLTKHQLLKKLIDLNLPVSEFSEHKVNLQDEYIKTVSEYKKAKAV